MKAPLVSRFRSAAGPEHTLMARYKSVIVRQYIGSTNNLRISPLFATAVHTSRLVLAVQQLHDSEVVVEKLIPSIFFNCMMVLLARIL